MYDEINRIKVTPIRIGISRLMTFLCTDIGRIIALSPSTSKRFAMHEPIIFPSDISALFWIAAPRDMANSGAEVPKATTITEIIRVETPNFAAVFDVPSTSASDDFQSIRIATMNAGSARMVGIMMVRNQNSCI